MVSFKSALGAFAIAAIVHTPYPAGAAISGRALPPVAVYTIDQHSIAAYGEFASTSVQPDDGFSAADYRAMDVERKAAIELCKDILAKHKDSAIPSLDCAIAADSLCVMYADSGKWASAIHYGRQALREFEALEGPVGLDVGIELNSLAWLSEQVGNKKCAHRLYAASIAILEFCPTATIDMVGIVENNYAELLLRERRYADSFRLYEKSYANFRSYFGAQDPLTKMVRRKMLSAARHLHAHSERKNVHSGSRSSNAQAVITARVGKL